MVRLLCVTRDALAKGERFFCNENFSKEKWNGNCNGSNDRRRKRKEPLCILKRTEHYIYSFVERYSNPRTVVSSRRAPDEYRENAQTRLPVP